MWDASAIVLHLEAPISEETPIMSRRIVQPPLDQWVTTGVENTVLAAMEGLAHSPNPHPLPVMEEPVTVEDFRHVAEETVRLNPNVARRA